MTYFLTGLVVAIGLFLWFHLSSKRQLMRNLKRAVDMVKIGLYARLQLKYEETYDKNFAGFLAAAVTNQVFSDEPSNDEGRYFLKENRTLIETELRNISRDQHLRHVLTQTLRARSVIPFAQGSQTSKDMDALSKLEEYGILIPGGEFPTLQSFYTLATEFYQTRPTGKVAEQGAEGDAVTLAP